MNDYKIKNILESLKEEVENGKVISEMESRNTNVTGYPLI